MAKTSYDVEINGVRARLADVEGRYKRRTVRRVISQQLLPTARGDQVFKGRDDALALYQSDWSAGARWWKPLMAGEELSSYFQSTNIDSWSEPGKLIPANKFAEVADSIHANNVLGTSEGAGVYAIGTTQLTTAGELDVYVWASGAWTRDTGQSSGIAVAENPLAMVYDPSDGYFYTVSDGDDLERFNYTANSKDANWITTGFTAQVGTNIFLQNQSLMLYDGNKLYTVNKSTPAVAEAFNDGMGADFLEGADPGTPIWERNLKLAISTPSGIYYVKNTLQGSTPVAWVFRVDKDVSGQWIGNPIATLPAGSVALSIAQHLGQIIVSTTPNWQSAVLNTQNLEIVLYFVGEGGMGAIGSVLGGRDTLDETPYALLGGVGAYLYLAGDKRLWLYDAVRGGLHVVTEWPTNDRPVTAMAQEFDGSGNRIALFKSEGRTITQKENNVSDPDTVTTFGDDETHYTLVSNFFDGGVPMELKDLTKVAVLHDRTDGDQQWKVQVAVDGGAFGDMLESNAANSIYAESDPIYGTSGYQFQYKVIYETKDTNRVALRAILAEMMTGEMVTEWDIILDGGELLNVDNQRQNPDEFYDNMVTLADRQGLSKFQDFYQDHLRTTSTANSTEIDVQVVAVEIMKDVPGESQVRLLLRGS